MESELNKHFLLSEYLSGTENYGENRVNSTFINWKIPDSKTEKENGFNFNVYLIY